MRSLKILSVLLITAFAVSVGHAQPPTIKNQPAVLQVDRTQQLVASYTSQIGVREATGHNDGVSVESYLRSVGLGKGFAWCAAFVKWNLQRVGIPNTINGMALSAHNKNNVVYYQRRFYKAVEPGDVFTLYYAHLKRIGHTGFFDRQVNASIYESVEGNTNEAGSREGDGVYRKKRSYKATYSITRWRLI